MQKKVNFGPPTFPVIHFFIPIDFLNSLLMWNFIFFIFSLYVGERREKVVGFRLKKKKIMISTDPDYEKEQIRCRLIALDKENIIVVVLSLNLVCKNKSRQWKKILTWFDLVFLVFFRLMNEFFYICYRSVY